MRAQVRPLSSQVPSPSSGILAPLASTAGVTSAIPLRRVRRADDALVGGTKLFQLGHLGIGEGKVEHGHVVGDVLRVGRARDRDDVLLHQVAQRDLRRRLAVRHTDARQHLVAGRGAARDRAIGRDRNAVAAAGGDHLRAVDERVHLDLVGDQRLARQLGGLLDQRHREVGDANMARLAGALGADQGVERLLQRHVLVGPVDQQEVDAGQFQALETFVDRALEVAGAQPVVPHFGGDKDLIARHAGGAQALAHLALVAVHLRRVDMAVAHPQRGIDRLHAGLLLQGHDAKADGGNAGAVRRDGLHRVSLCDLVDGGAGRRQRRVNIFPARRVQTHGSPFTRPVEAMPIALAGQFEVEYGETGTGPAVVLVHSSASGNRQWRRLADELEPRYRLIAINLFGYGATAPWPGDRPLTLGDAAELVVAVTEPLPEPIALVGHSLGAAVAFEAALRLGARVAKLIAYEPILFHLLAPHGFTAAATEIRGVASSYSARTAAGDWASAGKLFVDYWSGPGAWDDMTDERRHGVTKLLPNVR